MAIPVSQRSVASRWSPQPYSTGDGYAAPGRALSQLGDTISSFGEAMAEQQQKDETFQFKTDLQRFSNEQEMKFRGYLDQYQGSGHDFGPAVVQGFDSDYAKFRETVPPRLQQQADRYAERYRGDFQQRGFEVGQQKRGEWYVNQGTQLFATTILPRVTGDVRSAEAGLTAAEGIISSMDGIPPEVAGNLRKQAANSIFKKWLSAAGIEAGPQARAIVERMQASREGATPGSFRGAQDAGIDQDPTRAPPLTIHTDRVPSSSERRAIFRKGGVVVNFDTNWSPRGATEPMVVVPDGATAEQRRAAQAYATQIAAVYKEQFGRDVRPRVVTRSENGRGRAATIHTEPFAVTDPDAVRYFASDAGLARHAQIVRDTLGRIPGVEFSIPHNPARGDLGAHGNETNEVALAKALIGKLTGSETVVPARPYQVASNADVAPPGPVRAPTTREMFESLVAQNVDKIERNELKAMQKAEAEAERKERELQSQTRLQGYKLLFDRKLTPEWVDQNEANLSPSAFIELKKAVTPMGRTTDPQTLSDLLGAADERPQEIIEEATGAYGRGDLTYDDYRVIVGKARKAISPDVQSPPWVREQRSSVKEQLKPKRGASREEWEWYGQALKQYDAYVEKMGEGVDREKLAKFSASLIEETRTRATQQTRETLAMPRFAAEVGGSRATMTPEALDAILARTAMALQSGQITRADALAEAKKLKAWSEFLAKEQEIFGTMQKQGAGKFAAPALGGSAQVKAMTETLPDQIATMQLPPEALDAITKAVADAMQGMQQ